MNIDFTGKRAIICGGSRGIGRAIALGFAAAGGDVSICARGAETLERTRTEVAALGHKAHAGSCDLSDAAAIRSYITTAATELGGIDLLVNNASAFGSTDDEAGWMSSMAIDMMAIVHAKQAALPFLKETKGSVVNTSSIAAMHSAGLRHHVFISPMGVYGEVPGERYRGILDPYRDAALEIEGSEFDYTILRP